MLEREWMTELGRQLVLKRLQIRPGVNLGKVNLFEERLDRNIFIFLIAQLHRYGNITSLTQMDALWKLCKAYSGMAEGEFSGRVVGLLNN